MRTPEQKATILTIVIASLIMVGMTIDFWRKDHDWRTAIIPVIAGVILVPLGILKGRYLARRWFAQPK